MRGRHTEYLVQPFGSYIYMKNYTDQNFGICSISGGILN